MQMFSHLATTGLIFPFLSFLELFIITLFLCRAFHPFEIKINARQPKYIYDILKMCNKLSLQISLI